ncbi:hypothetical protein PINS_up004710 [Pythium insidiosum]|nr:hypothetical protein PINS_up004710 [Pythium insidiosum]
MSAEARASLLQTSLLQSHREDVETRALKTVVWERYRKAFMADLLAARENHAIGAGRGPQSPSKALLRKSVSTPELPRDKAAPLKPLVQPGSILLEMRPRRVSPAVSPAKRRKNKATARGAADVDPAATAEDTAQIPEESDSDSDGDGDSGSASALGQRRHSLTAKQAVKVVRRTSQMTLQETTEPVKDDARIRGDDDDEDDGSGTENASSELRRRSIATPLRSMVKSKTVAVLETAKEPPAVLPRLLQEKPLYGSSSLMAAGSDRRRSMRLRSDVGLVAKIQGATFHVSAIWNPVHGVCQPFSVLGFLKQEVTSPPPPQQHQQQQQQQLKIGARSASGLVAPTPTPSQRPIDADDTAAASAKGTSSVSSSSVITAFRVLGKFRDLDEALELFRHVCTLETAPPVDRDTSRFAIYKEDEMTMALENYFSDPRAAPYQYRALDLPTGNGQRFACIAVSVETPPRLLENVTVHVYQCFPTPQSAVRFARQMHSGTLATMGPLCIVPLFEWIPLADLERFDARSSELEQALESVMLPSVSSSHADGGISNFKARKEAMKKARLKV